jgi:cold shock CspA family protein
MNSNDQNTNTTTDPNSESPYMGRCKWFNNRAGYGFVTVLNGDKQGTDIFVHHSGVCVDQEQYRYLVQGEYVSFQMSQSDSKDHKWQATTVRGIMAGKLMCETHWEMRKERDERSRNAGVEPNYNESHDARDQHNQRNQRNQRPRRYGGGPRGDNEGFVLAPNGGNDARQATNDVKE